MPVLNGFRKTKELSLPDVPESKVVVYEGLLVGDMETLTQDGTAFQQALQWMPKLIKEWNLTNDQGETLPVNEASLRLFTANDLAYLIRECEEFTRSVKKN